MRRFAIWLLVPAACTPGTLPERIAHLRDGNVFLLNLETGTSERITEDAKYTDLAWLSPGRLLVSTQEPGEFAPETRWHVLSLESRKTSPVPRVPRAVPSPDSSLIAYPDPKGNRVFVKGLDAGEPTETFETSLLVLSISWSPEGRHLAVCVMEPRDPVPEGTEKPGLRLVDVRTKAARTAFEGHVLAPVWSPDGRWLAFLGRRDGKGGVWVVREDGQGLRFLSETHVLSHGIYFTVPAWSPDSRQLAFVSTRKENEFPYRIITVDRDGRERSELSETQKHRMEPSWSPSGAMILFVQADGYGSKDPELWVMRRDGTGARRLMEAAPAAWVLPGP